MKKLSLVEALFWIIGSTLLITGGGGMGINRYFKYQKKRQSDPNYLINRIVQTGPQRTPLNTAYLAELMGVSVDKPTPVAYFDPAIAEKRLTASPVIKEAHVKVIEPATLYVDYAVRNPVAALYDFKNIALDEEGVPFPIAPFFTPKNLPEIYLGIRHIQYRTPLQGKQVTLALSLLKLLSSLQFPIKRLDLSKAFDPSLGKREIVLITEDRGFSRYLRLSAKDYPQELGNYLELLPKLPLKPLVIDLRIQQLGFLYETPKS
jgi:hypothetical protein